MGRQCRRKAGMRGSVPPSGVLGGGPDDSSAQAPVLPHGRPGRSPWVPDFATVPSWLWWAFWGVNRWLEKYTVRTAVVADACQGASEESGLELLLPRNRMRGLVNSLSRMLCPPGSHHGVWSRRNWQVQGWLALEVRLRVGWSRLALHPILL